jgi:hypothetical protein
LIRFVPIRAISTGSPHLIRGYLLCRAPDLWPVVCRIPAGCIDAGKWFAPSRGCVTRLPGCQTRLPARFGLPQRLYLACISGPYFGGHARRGLPAFHITRNPAGLFTHGHHIRRARSRAPLFKQMTETHSLSMHQSSQQKAWMCPTSRRAYPCRAGVQTSRLGSVADRLIYPRAIILRRWPRWCTPLARRPDFPARRAISAFSPLLRR